MIDQNALLPRYFAAVDADEPERALELITEDFAFTGLFSDGPDAEPRQAGGDGAAFAAFLTSRGAQGRWHHLISCSRDGDVELAAGETREADGTAVGTFTCSAEIAADGRMRRYLLVRASGLAYAAAGRPVAPAPVGANPIIHVEFLADDDGVELKRFYTETFGWTTFPHPFEGHSLVQTGTPGEVTANMGPAASSDGETPITLWIDVADVLEMVERVQANGGELVGTPFAIPNGPTTARFRDPSGNVIGLASQGRENFARATGG